MDMPMRSSTSGSIADRIYRQTSSVGIGIGAFWTLVWAVLGLRPLVVFGVLGLAGMVTCRLLRRRIGYPTATRISVLSCLVMLCGAIVHTGGMKGPFGVMMIILPLGPALALGTRESLRWGGVVLVVGGLLWYLDEAVRPFPYEVPAPYAAPMRGLAQISVLAGTLLCLYTYGRMHEMARQRLRRSRAELEAANRELQLSQQKLLVSDKMAALGRLTAGMAHEINSTLAGAINSLELARVDAEALEGTVAGSAEGEELVAEVRDSVGLALTALGKIAAFVRRMRGQTSLEENAPTSTFSPADEAQTVLRLLQVLLVEKRINLHTEITPKGRLRGDPSRFGQIIQNLVTNAADAYEGEPGQVTVRLFAMDSQVVVEVEDEGSGIPEDIRAHIFDHFFTTKGVGKGTGLGLAMVHDLATQYFGGSIDFDSEVGHGTRFLIRLPAVEEAA